MMRPNLPLRLAILVLLVGCGPVAAEVPASGPPAFDRAFAGLDALVRAKGSPARLGKPWEAEALKAVWDVDAYLGRPPYGAADVGPLLDMFGKQGRLFKSYALAAPPGAVPDTARNTAVYQDEIVRAQAAMLRVIGALSPAMSDFVRKLKPADLTATRRDGLRQARLGLLEMISGAALTLRSPALRDPNRVILADALARDGDGLAALMTRPDREAASAAMRTALPSLTPEARAGANRFIAALADERCETLCAIE
ncbi:MULTISPECIES: hypothetical protein [Methylobacterium]|nr:MULTISPECIES: hypothetical protein [Methylobacterium]